MLLLLRPLLQVCSTRKEQEQEEKGKEEDAWAGACVRYQFAACTSLLGDNGCLDWLASKWSSELQHSHTRDTLAYKKT